MFYEVIKKEATPERVFELCKIIELHNGDSEAIIRKMLEPDVLNEDGSSYYNSIKEAAIELKMTDKNLNLLISPEKIKSMETMRQYCNSFLFKNQNGIFYKLSKCFLDSNDIWLRFSNFTDQKAMDYLRKYSDIPKVEEDMLRGLRFWISYLGFIYIHENSKKKITLLPNMYVALKDFIDASNIEKEKEYKIAEFIDSIRRISAVSIGGVERREINLAMSNALRQMHDNKEIIISRKLDSEEVWRLFENKQHLVPNEITHIYFY
jgi:hypothetical protein